MEHTFSPMIRQYSAIDGLQQEYTLVYAMEVEGTQGCPCAGSAADSRSSVSMLRQRRSSVTGSCATCVKMEFSRSSGGMRSQT